MTWRYCQQPTTQTTTVRKRIIHSRFHCSGGVMVMVSLAIISFGLGRQRIFPTRRKRGNRERKRKTKQDLAFVAGKKSSRSVICFSVFSCALQSCVALLQGCYTPPVRASVMSRRPSASVIVIIIPLTLLVLCALHCMSSSNAKVFH